MIPGTRLRRWLSGGLAATIPLLLFLNVLQGVRYTRLEREVKQLEQEQIAWYEKNKTLLASIGIYSSPRRLQDMVAETRREDPHRPVVRVEVEADEGGSGGDGAR